MDRKAMLIADDNNAVAIESVMAIPNAHRPPLTDTGIGGESQIW